MDTFRGPIEKRKCIQTTAESGVKQCYFLASRIRKLLIQTLAKYLHQASFFVSLIVAYGSTSFLSIDVNSSSASDRSNLSVNMRFQGTDRFS
jgi:hypothetical protein